ncbi:MAG: glycosyltransferase family 4 protein, partial [Vicinamibacterales bacterium]
AARVGWVTYDSFPGRKKRFRDLDPFTGMRVGNVAQWMNAQRPDLVNEIYDSSERYDVVVFQKMMDARCQDEAARIRAAGGKVVFDANVNYYEIWGDYFVPGTRPTDTQQRDAIAMTTAADWVVADSTYLEGIIRKMNPRVTWIPDNVDMRIYGGRRIPQADHPIRLVWSGVGKKAAHLLLLTDVFAALPEAELVLVVDTEPDCLPQLERVVRCRIVRFTGRVYARTLAASDILISPKRLINAYEMAHTEYKISLGMAMGLPVVASPQPSYVEAIGHHGGGIIASSTDEWIGALRRLAASPELRAELGTRARQTVDEHYATPVVAAQYLSLLATLAGVPAATAAARS